MNNNRRVDRTDTVNDSELMLRIYQRLENTYQPQITPASRCIYKTPKLLRKVNEAAYTPRHVSIGPYHYGNEDLQRMENVKGRYLRNYLDRTQRTLEDILGYIKECKEELKSYYAEEVFLSDTSFVDMILSDGIFIIELFLRMSYPDLVQSGDEILLQSIDLKNDLFFMQENQLPWFFIEELYNKDVIEHVPDRIPFPDLALSICSRHVPSPFPWRCPDIDMIGELGVKHLHDLLRTTIIHPLLAQAYRHPLLSHKYHLPSAGQRLSATVLHEAGVKFKICESESFLDIAFYKGALYMPSFMFDHNTETFARNLMAYEQCRYQEGICLTFLCDYFYLMDSLINTSKDVDLLVKSGIIINRLGDNDEVVTLVNNLFKHVRIDLNQFYYANLCEVLDEHCKNNWNNWKTTFKISAIIILLLTLIQTYKLLSNYWGFDRELHRLNQRLKNADQPQITSSPHCIYRTPKLLRKVNEAAYTPRLVSIGPFHFGNEDLQIMENVKDRYLRNYLDRTQRTLKDILSYIEECKEELKSCYAETTLDSLDASFVEIILLDGVFIIELFLGMFYRDLVHSSDVILLQSIDLKNDLFFMLENQRPWFFIEELYNKDVIQHVPHRKPFLDIALSICSDHVPWHCPDINMIRGLGVKHLHDLLRTTIHPLLPRIIHPPLPVAIMRILFAQQRLSATVLHEAGVKFKVRESKIESKSFLDITFYEGALYMPSFIFDLDRHCKNSWNKWKAMFKRDYLSTPWKVASTVAAIILLLLTLTETVCSIISLFNKK